MLVNDVSVFEERTERNMISPCFDKRYIQLRLRLHTRER
jgi:hypothetical protein